MALRLCLQGQWTKYEFNSFLIVLDIYHIGSNDELIKWAAIRRRL
jgi:hypothetical protein